ncbi:MAG: ROK family protein, partial [Clostridia bacterium]|nr:ROK family protein [Clostridia bacterium]
AGDRLSIEIYRKCGEMFGYTLSILMDILNPELIVVGSIYGRSRNLLEDAMQVVIRREALQETICPIVPAALGEYIGDYAALAVAAESKGI